MNEKLKPCHACKPSERYPCYLTEKTNHIPNRERKSYRVECDNCGQHGTWESTEALAVDSWNTRPIEDALRAERDELRADLAALNLLGASEPVDAYCAAHTHANRATEAICSLMFQRNALRAENLDLKTKIGTYIESRFDGQVERDALRAENARLKARVERLETIVTRYQANNHTQREIADVELLQLQKEDSDGRV